MDRLSLGICMALLTEAVAKGLTGWRLHPFLWGSVFVGVTNSSAIAGTARSPLDDLIAPAGTQRLESARPVGDAVVLENLAKTYPDGSEAVRGISLRVAAGEAFGILGPNGSGKSTTVGMLGTLVKPTAGRAWVAGFDVVAEPVEVRRRIGFAMQQAGVDDFATPKELMILQGRLHGLRKHEAAARAGLLLAVMELAKEADRRLATQASRTSTCTTPVAPSRTRGWPHDRADTNASARAARAGAVSAQPGRARLLGDAGADHVPGLRRALRARRAAARLPHRQLLRVPRPHGDPARDRARHRQRRRRAGRRYAKRLLLQAADDADLGRRRDARAAAGRLPPAGGASRAGTAAGDRARSRGCDRGPWSAVDDHYGHPARDRHLRRDQRQPGDPYPRCRVGSGDPADGIPADLPDERLPVQRPHRQRRAAHDHRA